MAVSALMSEPIRRAVERSFLPEHQAAAFEILLARSRYGADRILAGMVILSFGDLERLQDWAERDRRDWRDVLYRLDQPEDPLTRTILIDRARHLELCGIAYPRADEATMRARRENAVKKLMADELIIPMDRLQRPTCLQELVGDTAQGVEFLARFARAFNVDMTEFEPKRYFVDRNWSACRRVLRLPIGPVTTITVGDLADAVERKRWQA